uniref:Cytochrome b n=1 Tax=Brachionus manjavacas TaxID=667381 RepID=A0A8A2Z0U2_9BILA|nr:cytochrome b [Brachionus manjavacas]QSX43088.1 cytochrome b [Brachionus manjavacas]
MSFRKNHPLVKIVNSTLVDLPSPANLSVNWNYGSLLGLVLVIQLVSGIVLATRFSGHSDMSFDSVISIYQDSNYGWLLRLVHSTGASFFFLFIYLHIGRGLYYGSYVYPEVWNIGVLIYLILMGTAFLGYVLPWGQMSYWAATVITNLLSAIPWLGSTVVEWVWGGFAVGNPTLTRFFALHYLLPFLVTALVILHIFYLHIYGSSNPLGISSNTNKVSFHYYYSVKDLYVYFVFFFIFMVFTLKYGYVFMDAENFIPANPLVTPTHIQPEWYFLFAYAILRSIPNKLGGVVGLLLAVLVLFLFSFSTSKLLFSGTIYSPLARLLFWSLVSNFLLLTWLGSCPAESPYTEVALVATVTYFSFMLMMCALPHLSTYLYLKS